MAIEKLAEHKTRLADFGRQILTFPHAGKERAPLVSREPQHRAVRVLAVTHRDDAGHVGGYLDATTLWIGRIA